jgi:hypothetical protein
VDHQHCKNSEAANMANASQDCVGGTRKKADEVALNGVEGVKASESTHVRRKHNSQSVKSTVNGGRRYNAPSRPRMSVVQLLKEYNEARQRTEFNRNFHTCKICFQVTSLILTCLRKFQMPRATLSATVFLISALPASCCGKHLSTVWQVSTEQKTLT